MTSERLDVTPPSEGAGKTHAIAYAPADENLVLFDVCRTSRVSPWEEGDVRRRSDFLCDLNEVAWLRHDVEQDPEVFQCRVRQIGPSDLRPLGRHDVFPRKRTGAKGLPAYRYYVCCETAEQAIAEVVAEPACELLLGDDPAIVSGQMMHLALMAPDTFLALGKGTYEDGNLCCLASDKSVACAYPASLVQGLGDEWVDCRVGLMDGTSFVMHTRRDTLSGTSRDDLREELRAQVARDLGARANVTILTPDPRDHLCATFLFEDDGSVGQAIRTRAMLDPEDLGGMVTEMVGHLSGDEHTEVRHITPKECLDAILGHKENVRVVRTTPVSA